MRFLPRLGSWLVLSCSVSLAVLGMATMATIAIATVALPAEAGELKAGELKGRVLLEDKPAPGVTVAALPYETPLEEARRDARALPSPQPLASTVTGSDGSWLLRLSSEPGPRPAFRLRFAGTGVVPVQSEGVYEAEESLDVGEWMLSPAKKLAGKIVDEKGEPVASARLLLQPGIGRQDEDSELRTVPRVGSTAADGTFRFEEAGETANTLTIEAKGLAIARIPGLKAGAIARAVVLGPGSTLEGRVMKSDRKSAAAKALVRFEGKALSRWVETDAEGRFSLPDLPAGRGGLLVDGDATGFASQSLTVPPPPERPLVLVLTPAASVEGRVVDAKSGRPVPRARVEMKSGDSLRVARSSPDGRYQIKPLLPQRYSLKGDEPRYVPFSREDLILSPGEARKIDLPLTLGASIAGRVVEENGAPVAGAKGRLSRPAGSGLMALLKQMRSAPGVTFRSRVDGTFKASRLSPGENLQLSVSHPEFEKSSLGGVTLVGGATKGNLSIVLRRGLSVVGLVHDAEGNPIPGVSLELSQARSVVGGRGGMRAQISVVGAQADRPKAKSGADGRFEFKGLSTGEYTLSAKKPSFATETLDAVKVGEGTPAAPLAITLSPGAAVAGVVRHRNGNGAEGFFVGARPAGGSSGLPRVGDADPTGPDGFFTLEGLKAGETYDLQVFGGTGLGPVKKGVTAPADGVDIVVTGTGKIAGTALEADGGRPLTDFEVSYEPERTGGGMGAVFRMGNRAAGRRVTSLGEKTPVHSEDGSFVLEDVPAGTWQLVVQAKGYQQAHVGGVVVEEASVKQGVDVRVAKGGTLKGRVSDARSGKPIPNASVSTSSPSGGPMGAIPMQLDEGEIPTDADGRFEVDGLGTGRLRVTVKHPDYAELTETVEVKEKEPETAAELKMTAGGLLAGTVFSEAHQPAPSVEVSLSAAGESGFGRFAFGSGQSAMTDETGRFRFDHLSAGRYSATASLRSQSSAPVEVALGAGESKEDVVLTLAVGSTIRGSVTGLPESQRAGVNVNAFGPQGYSSSVRTGTDGRFELSGAPEGVINLRATAGDFVGSTRSAIRQVTIPAGQTQVDTEIVFDVGFSLSGRVTRRGEPVGSGFVMASPQGTGGASASARTDESGAYRLEGLKEATYVVNATSGAFGGSSRRETVKVSGDQTLDLVFPAAVLSGSVVESGSKQPLADAIISIVSQDPSSGGGFFGRAATSDSNGRFSLEDLDPKSYTLTVRKPDFLFDKRDVMAAEQGSDNLVLELVRGEGIGIQARDAVYNVPLRGLMARVQDGQKATVFTGSLSLDSEGRGEIPSLKPGRYTVYVDASSYAPAALENVNVPSPTLQVALTPGGSVEVLAGPKTVALGSPRCRILTAAGFPYMFSLFSTDGSFPLGGSVRRLSNIAPGTYTISVDGGTGSQPFTVNEGRETVVQLP